MASVDFGNRGLVMPRPARLVATTSRWTLALAVVLSVWVLAAGQTQARETKSGHHIYCIRGAFNVFSLGMDEVCQKLSKMGYNTSIHNHMTWSSLADEAAASYKSGRERTIILIGHSAGAGAVADIAEQLGKLSVPVRLAVELDCTWGTTASGHVDQFINFYVGSGAGKRLSRGAHFSGVLQNIDVSKNNTLGHFNIDKDPAIQAKVIGYVRQALAHPAQQNPTTAAPTASTGTTNGMSTVSAKPR